MKFKIALGLSTAAVLCIVLARPLGSEEGSDKGEGGGGEMPEWMQAGPEHKKLAELAGDWDVDGEFHMEPGAPATKSKATAKFEVILDGKFVQQTFKGEMMGMPFTGHGIDGYDRAAKKWTSFWCDSMGTAPMYLLGESKDDGKTVEYKGEMLDPDSKKMTKIRTVHTEKSKDQFTFEMFGEHDGKEGLFFKLTYNRKK